LRGLLRGYYFADNYLKEISRNISPNMDPILPYMGIQVQGRGGQGPKFQGDPRPPPMNMINIRIFLFSVILEKHHIAWKIGFCV
jgi:hypothetical protein